MERSLLLRGGMFGLESIQVQTACKATAEMCNYVAMTALQQGKTETTQNRKNKINRTEASYQENIVCFLSDIAS